VCPPSISCSVTKSAALTPDTGASAVALFKGAHTRIGVFDSGLGGLSVLKALHERLPLADLTYVADSAHAPYGERDDDFIAARSKDICDHLIAASVDAIVVACNTATAAAIHLLREAYPGMPIIGVEPGVKPAVAHSGNKRIGVLATPSTLASDKYKRLIETHGHGATIVSQACPGLAKEIESGQLDTPALRDLIERFSEPLRNANVDTVVLGCTHYPFVAPLFQQALGDKVNIVDTAKAVTEHTARLCVKNQGVHPGLQAHHTSTGKLRFCTSADPAHLATVVYNWLGVSCDVTRLN
jgi:glutamate racemase